MMPEQLAFPFFISEPEPVLPRPSRYRRRLARVAAIALELGQRQGKRRTIPQRLASAVVQAPVMAFHPSREDRHELLILASRVARLTISRRDPESFFIERSEIANELRRIARTAPSRRRIAGLRPKPTCSTIFGSAHPSIEVLLDPKHQPELL